MTPENPKPLRSTADMIITSPSNIGMTAITTTTLVVSPKR